MSTWRSAIPLDRPADGTAWTPRGLDATDRPAMCRWDEIPCTMGLQPPIAKSRPPTGGGHLTLPFEPAYAFRSGQSPELSPSGVCLFGLIFVR
jgi:hypothetical protein